MSSARTLILGVFNGENRPMHGYEIRQTLESWGAEHWGNVAYGSIYFALSKMAAEGLLTEAGTESGRGPDRKLYELTEQGRQVFLALVREHWWRYKHPVDRMPTAIAFMDVLPREELLAALRARAAGFRRALAQYPEWTRAKLDAGAPRHSIESLRRGEAMERAELQWIEDVIEKVERGELP